MWEDGPDARAGHSAAMGCGANADPESGDGGQVSSAFTRRRVGDAGDAVTRSELKVLLIFGGITVIYTVMGGLSGVVFVDVVQFLVLLVGSCIFLFFAVD